MKWLILALACGDTDPGEETCTPTDEVCDGIDSDCDGQVDEGVLDTVYADADGDGLGDPAAPNAACGTDWPGYAANADDCDDSNAAWPAEAWADGDGDGYASDDAEAVLVCDVVGYATEQGDCDDADPGAYPEAEESCGNGVDEDCDGEDLQCPDTGHEDSGDSGPGDSG